MNTLAPSFMIGSSSFLQVTRTYMKAWMSSNFNHIPPPTPEYFRKFATELRPLIDSRIRFLLHILRMNGQNLTKFCIHIIIDKIYVGIVKHHILANLQQSYDP